MKNHEPVNPNWKFVTYRGFTGLIVAKQLALPANGMEAGYLIAFSKPKKTRKITDAEFDLITQRFAEVFECNPECLGPCVNRIVSESELKQENPALEF